MEAKICTISTFFLAGFIILSHASEPEVSLKIGKLKGVVSRSYAGREFNAYLGIPFAKPPIGSLRFQDPVPPEPWSGTLDASKPGNMCLQMQDEGNEDCLYLNIYTPKIDSTNGKGLDVLVAIHGGGFQNGFSHMQEPDYLMDRDDLILVTFNYRLGILGFLSLGDEYLPGNYGLKDQVLALRWIKENIGSFGGDANKITLLGCSAGGASVHYHVLSPLSKGLFQKAIMMSGTALDPWAKKVDPKSATLEVAEAIGCPVDGCHSKIVECLKEQPADLLTKKASIFVKYLIFDGMHIGPVVEKAGNSKEPFILTEPEELIKAGKISNVPLLISHTDTDGMFLAAEVLKKDEYIDELETRWYELAPIVFDFESGDEQKDRKTAQSIREFYFGQRSIRENPLNLVKLFTERYLSLGAQKAAKLHALVSKSPVYAYIFSHVGKPRLTDLLNVTFTFQGGADHADDFMYVLPMPTIRKQIENPSELAMSLRMIETVMKFIKGTPVKGWRTVQSGLPNLTYLKISGPDEVDEFQTLTDFSSHKFWESLKIGGSSAKKAARTEL
ncbi:Carboxylesterase [Nesidiocoris tenuis]|uniref:Carboxylic ester hydrolase n=1 Tax=Nesidiocoris tenuis TaxID=355587 RepID=A0ABN7AZN6_9HEMI|nr:Carboxylesterase [Nesidiocoris tenuis]